MAHSLWSIYPYGRNRRLASVVLFAIATLLPKILVCSEMSDSFQNTLSSIEHENCETIRYRFDAIEQTISAADDPKLNCHEFLLSFIAEINNRYHMNLSLEAACKLIKENMGQLPLAQFEKNSLLSIIDLLETRDFSLNSPSCEASSNSTSHEQIHFHFYWPWAWKWFGLNEREHSKNGVSITPIRTPFF